MDVQLSIVLEFKILSDLLIYLIDLNYLKFIASIWQIMYQQKNVLGKIKLKMLLILNTYLNLELL